MFQPDDTKLTPADDGSLVTIPVIRKVLEKNAAAANENRAWFRRHEAICVNILGGPGSGKTALLEAVIPRLRQYVSMAVLEGDLATTRDAERIARLGVPTVQLLTEGGCHLKAEHVQRALEGPGIAEADIVFIENVGNLVCPANFDLGENLRVVVLSVVEGDDKPSKYGLMFRKADLCVLSKWDLLPFVTFDADRTHADLRLLHPELPIVETDIHSGRGIAAVAEWLHARRAEAVVSNLKTTGVTR